MRLSESQQKPGFSVKPPITWPQVFAVVVFVFFVALAWLATDTGDPNADWNLNAVEYDELRTFTLIVIAALLPSDALIRFGRNILFSKIDKPDDAAEYAPATTIAQALVLVVYGSVVVAMLAGNNIVTEAEGRQILDVAQALTLALLPSDAAIRFARALNLSKLGTDAEVTQGQLKRV